MHIFNLHIKKPEFEVLEIWKSKMVQKSLVLFTFDIFESIFKSARTLSAISTSQARQII